MTAPAQVEAGPAIDVMIESPLWRAMSGADAVIRRALEGAAERVPERRWRDREVVVLLCDDAAIAELNARWRGHDHATNVLSFPAPPVAGAVPAQLGDIAVAYETAAREGREQGKELADHLAHLVVHGFLHLLGYDHHEDAEAEHMERLERDILGRIGIADPYASRDAEP
jgi:probable rRNA maturation factor